MLFYRLRRPLLLRRFQWRVREAQVNGATKASPFGAPDYIPATDSPHHPPVLEQLEKCIGLGGDPVSVRLWYILLI